MSRTNSSNPDFLNGVPELLVLQLLAATPMHGYDVVRMIQAASRDRFTFGEGCIYPILHRLERAGVLAAARDESGKRPRIVYRVTPAGLARLAESTATWESVVRGVRTVLHGGGDAEPNLA